MMGREVNSIATAREKCRQLLWQAALQLYVELAAVGRWLSVRLSVPRSCCRSSQLTGGVITKAKIQTKTKGIVAVLFFG